MLFFCRIVIIVGISVGLGSQVMGHSKIPPHLMPIVDCDEAPLYTRYYHLLLIQNLCDNYYFYVVFYVLG